MPSFHRLILVGILISVGMLLPAATPAADLGASCRIDNVSFEGDPDITRIDYVVPPNGKPSKFRLIAMHADDAVGAVSVQMKTVGTVSTGTAPLSQEPLWKSVVQLPKQRDSAVISGDITFTHFEPHGDKIAAGTLQFATADGHKGECHFRLSMQVVDLGSLAPNR